MTDKNIEQQIVSRIRSALEQSRDRLEPGIRSRLNRMRHEAVARQAAQPPWRRRWPFATGLLATAAAAGLILFLPLNRPAEKTPLAAMDDMEILASSDPLEIYEDMEFYTWLSDLENEIQDS